MDWANILACGSMTRMLKRIESACPCKGCTERTEFGACHATCKKYIDWCKEKREYQNKVTSQKIASYEAKEFSFRRIKRER